MNSELIAALDYFEREKGIKREILIEAVANALLQASKKSVGPARDLRIDINPKSGEIRALASLTVVEKVMDPFSDQILTYQSAQKLKPGVAVGDIDGVEVTPKDFGRISAQTAKQAMLQRIRSAEKEMMYDEFKDRAGEIVRGTVRRFERSDVIMDLGKFDAIMPSKERVVTEDYNVGDQLRAYVMAVENGMRGPEIILSRSHPNFVRRLFELEVSEINDRTVEIRGLAREAGYRTKIAVHSANEKVDPVGACVGMRGSRVKNIVRELNNEKVDIIRWHAEPREFILEALKPARVKSLTLDPVKKAATDQGGRRPTFARHRQARAERPAHRQADRLGDQHREGRERGLVVMENKVTQAASVLAANLAIGLPLAQTLVKNGLLNVDSLLEVEPQDLADILEIDLEQATAIHEKARAGQPANG